MVADVSFVGLTLPFKQSLRSRVSNWFHVQRRPAPGERKPGRKRSKGHFRREGGAFPEAFACVNVCTSADVGMERLQASLQAVFPQEEYGW